MAALSFAGYMLFPAISITGTKIHLGNVFVVLAAYLLGGVTGGLSGAIGLTLADIISGYAASAPRTFICKFLIGLIVGLVFYKLGKMKNEKDNKKVLVWSIIAAVAGLGFNCIFEPALKYFWYTILIPNADKAGAAVKTMVALTSWVTVVNCVINGIIAVILYQALRPALKKLNLI